MRTLGRRVLMADSSISHNKTSRGIGLRWVKDTRLSTLVPDPRLIYFEINFEPKDT